MRLMMPDCATHSSAHNRADHYEREERKEELAPSSAPEWNGAFRMMQVLFLADGAIFLPTYPVVVPLARSWRKRWTRTSGWDGWCARGRCGC